MTENIEKPKFSRRNALKIFAATGVLALADTACRYFPDNLSMSKMSNPKDLTLPNGASIHCRTSGETIFSKEGNMAFQSQTPAEILEVSLYSQSTGVVNQRKIGIVKFENNEEVTATLKVQIPALDKLAIISLKSNDPRFLSALGLIGIGEKINIPTIQYQGTVQNLNQDDGYTHAHKLIDFDQNLVEVKWDEVRFG